MAPPLPACIPQAGGLYWIRNAKGRYDVFKVLAVDAKGVHVRLYTLSFAAPPTAADLAAARPLPWFIGHLPLSHRSYAAWDAQLVDAEPVGEEELEGYQMWIEADGGVFG
jgi:hypothetical protein